MKKQLFKSSVNISSKVFKLLGGQIKMGSVSGPFFISADEYNNHLKIHLINLTPQPIPAFQESAMKFVSVFF